MVRPAIPASEPWLKGCYIRMLDLQICIQLYLLCFFCVHLEYSYQICLVEALSNVPSILILV